LAGGVSRGANFAWQAKASVKAILVATSTLHRDINAPLSPHYHHGGLGKHWSSAPCAMQFLDDVTRELPPLTLSIVMREKHEWKRRKHMQSTPLARLLSGRESKLCCARCVNPVIQARVLLNPSVGTQLTFLDSHDLLCIGTPALFLPHLPSQLHFPLDLLCPAQKVSIECTEPGLISTVAAGAIAIAGVQTVALGICPTSSA
jgi:hypothetical protein